MCEPISKNLQKLYRQQETFQPPYCPKPDCRYYKSAPESGFRKERWAALVSYPHKVKVYRCRACNRTVRYSAFTLDYRMKKRFLSKSVFGLIRLGVSNRATGNEIGLSEKGVRIRIKRMMKAALIVHTSKMEGFQIGEHIVYDGLQNFAYSQYDPNLINHAIGARSLFVYNFNFATKNRTGRMSERQKEKKLEIEKEFGVYPKDAERKSTVTALKWLLERCGDGLGLETDNHYQSTITISIGKRFK